MKRLVFLQTTFAGTFYMVMFVEISASILHGVSNVSKIFFQRSMYYSVYTVTYATTNLEGELSICSAAVTEICERDVL